MILKYKSNLFNITVTEVEVIRESKNSVWFYLDGVETKAKKIGGFESFHDSYAEAKNHIKKSWETSIRNHRITIQQRHQSIAKCEEYLIKAKLL